MSSKFFVAAAVLAFLAPLADAQTAINYGSFGAAGNGTYGAGATVITGGGPLAAAGDQYVSYADGLAGTLIPYSSTLNPQGPFTVELWVKPNIVPNSAGTPCPISSAQFNLDRSGWQIRERDTGYQFVLYNHVGSGTAANVLGGGVPSTSGWTYLAGVFDGTTASLFVNGVLANSSAAPGFVADDNAGGTGPLTVGYRSSLDNYFNGAADEVAIYGAALSPAQILAHFNAASSLTPDAYSSSILGDNPLEYLPTQVVPEPSALALISFGIVGLMVRHLRRRN
ncbi:MAG TPA: LamG-like jellyroll fold domain-containing protein [Methylomirabilota bacterium]|jgi:hypothetical protein|nr:LamG-like jellyroll fold domain-containing protein [Methylomirabilota bacterium]